LLALCFGTRPQVVKASMLLEVLRSRWPVIAVDTGQHYDFELNGLFYEQLGIPQPDHFLEVGSDTPASQTAAVLSRTADILRDKQPAAVIVIGDTSSTLGAALAASKEGYPLVHVEAGLRSAEQVAMSVDSLFRAVNPVAKPPEGKAIDAAIGKMFEDLPSKPADFDPKKFSANLQAIAKSIK